MNREALPFILALSIPIVLVSLVLLQIYGYDLTSFFRELDIIYYIIILPLALGFIVTILISGKNWEELQRNAKSTDHNIFILARMWPKFLHKIKYFI